MDEKTIEIKSPEDFENFRSTLQDKNLISGYTFIWYGTPFVIKGDDPVTFKDCTIDQQVDQDDSDESRSIVSSVQGISFDSCSFPKPHTVIFLKTQDGYEHCWTTFDNPVAATLSLISKQGRWNIGIALNANTCAHLDVIDAEVLKLQGGLPDYCYIADTHVVDIANVISDSKHNIYVTRAHELRISQVYCRNSTLEIASCLMSELLLLYATLNIIKVIHANISYMRVAKSDISLLGASCSVCDKFSVSLSKMPTAMQNSAGFPDREHLVLFKKVQLARFSLFGKKHRNVETVLMKLIVEPGTKKTLGIHDGGLHKIRVEKATPVKIYRLPDVIPFKKPFLSVIRSIFRPKYRYRIGHPATPEFPFDESAESCSSGIHGFLSVEEAKDFNL